MRIGYLGEVGITGKKHRRGKKIDLFRMNQAEKKESTYPSFGGIKENHMCGSRKGNTKGKNPHLEWEQTERRD